MTSRQLSLLPPNSCSSSTGTPPLPAPAKNKLTRPVSMQGMPETLLRDVAAVDHQLRPGDERCLVGGEEQHAISNFDRLTEAAEWSERHLVRRLPKPPSLVRG